MPDDDQQPACRRGRRCYARTAYTDTISAHRTAIRYVGSPDIGPGGLCGVCSRQAWWAVHDLAVDADQLHHAITATAFAAPGTNRDPAMPRSTYKERPIELDLHADELLREIEHEAVVWAEHLDERLDELDPDHRTTGDRWTPPRRGQLTRRVRAATNLLLAHWDQLLDIGPQAYRSHTGHPAAADTARHVELLNDGMVAWVDRDGASAALALHDLHWRCMSMTGYTVPPTRYPDPCPHCTARGRLVRYAPRRAGDQAPLRCEACGQGVDEQTWDWWAGALAEGFTPDQAHLALTRGNRRRRGTHTGGTG